MTVKPQGDHWLATGQGPLRPIAAEGLSRKEAIAAWAALFQQQIQEKRNAERR